MNKKKREIDFSKLLITFESFILGVMSLCTLYFCYVSITLNYMGALPYLTTMTVAAWAAYGVSASFYYRESQAENTKGGIKYECAMREMNRQDNNSERNEDSHGH